MKISVVVASFSITGVPLAQARFARALAARNHDVEFLIGNINSDTPVPVIEGVTVQVWQYTSVRAMLIPLIRYFNQVKPDVVFPAEDHLVAIVLIAAILSGTKAKISGSSRIFPADNLAYSNKLFTKGWLLKKIMEMVMWRADALTCVSSDMVDHYRKLFPNSPHVNVYNIVKDKNSLKQAGEAVKHDWLVNKKVPVIISAGTMKKIKGFSDLINAFALLMKQRPLKLIILGDGELRDKHIRQVKELGLSQEISLPGAASNPLKYFSKADVFVLSSYTEGLPNVLVEAMMCGCTPVSTNCQTGPREVLADGKYGYLVPVGDITAMANAIVQALDTPISPEVLAEAVTPFEEDIVIKRHFEILGL